jgi:hypothetical protein
MARKNSKASSSSSDKTGKDEERNGMDVDEPLHDDKQRQLQVFIDQFWLPLQSDILEPMFAMTREQIAAFLDGERYVNAYTQVYLCCVTPIVIKLSAGGEHSEYFHGRQIYGRLRHFLQVQVGATCQQLRTCADASQMLAAYLQGWSNFQAFTEQTVKIFNYVERHWIAIVNANHRRSFPSPPVQAADDATSHLEEKGEERSWRQSRKTDIDLLQVMPIATLHYQIWHEYVIAPLHQVLVPQAIALVRSTNEGPFAAEPFFQSLMAVSRHLKAQSRHQLRHDIVLTAYQADLTRHLDEQLPQFGREPTAGKLYAALEDVWAVEALRLCDLFLVPTDGKDPSPSLEGSEDDVVKPLKRCLREHFLERLPMDSVITETYRRLLHQETHSSSFELEEKLLRQYYLVVMAYRTLYDRAVGLFRQAFQQHLRERDGRQLERAMDSVFECTVRAQDVIMRVFDGDLKFLEARDEVLREDVFDGQRSPQAIPLLVNRLHQFLVSPSPSSYPISPTSASASHEADSGNAEADPPKSTGLLLSPIRALMSLFKFVGDKDRFRHVYAQSLAWRLLQGTYTPDWETLVIGGMRDMCGPGFVNSLERMLQDVQSLSAQTVESLNASQTGQVCDLGVLFLSGGVWPSAVVGGGVALQADDDWCPPEARDYVHRVQQQFLRLQPKKKLVWLPQLSKVSVVLESAQGRRMTVVLNALQYAVMAKVVSSTTLCPVSAISSPPSSSKPSVLQSLLRCGLLLHDTSTFSVCFNAQFLDSASISPKEEGQSNKLLDISAMDDESTTMLRFQHRETANHPHSHHHQQVDEGQSADGPKPSTVGTLKAGDWTLWLQCQATRLCKLRYAAANGDDKKAQIALGDLRRAFIQLRDDGPSALTDADLRSALASLSERRILDLFDDTDSVSYVP